MGEFLLEVVKWLLVVIAGDFVLAMACGTIFASYFNAKKKFLKEMSPFHDQTDGR